MVEREKKIELMCIEKVSLQNKEPVLPIREQRKVVAGFEFLSLVQLMEIFSLTSYIYEVT